MRSPRAVPPPASMACSGGPCTVGVPPPPPLQLTSILPRGGPAVGNTDVRLHINGAAWNEALSAVMRCDFGSAGQHAWMQTEPDVAEASGSHVHCKSPGTAIAGVVSMRFSMGGAHIAGSMPFRYYDPPSVRALQPSSGPISGGTVVLVLGAGFGPYPDLGDAVALCRFGTHATAPPQRRGDGTEAGSGGALQPAGLAVHEPTLRTHLPRFVTTPASILHDGALRCRAPAAMGLGQYAVARHGHPVPTYINE